LSSKSTPLETQLPVSWDPVIPFDEISTPEISADFLPSFVGDFVREVSDCAQTPEALGVALGFSTLAASLQGKVAVSPYGDDYIEPVNIWTVAVLPPGSRKSFVQSQLTRPLVDWEREAAEKMKPVSVQIEAVRSVTDKRIDRLRQQAAKKENSTERDVITQEIVELIQTMPKEIRAPRIFTDDCTPERFQGLLVEHGERMGVLSDEGGIFEVMSGLYSDGRANIDVFLKSHAGSPVRVDRGTREAYLNHPLSTFGLAVQPSIIEDLNQGSKRKFRGNGCLARLLYFLPASNIGRRDHTRRRLISEVTRCRYHEGIRNLLDIQPTIVDGVEKPRILKVHPEALVSWIAFQQTLEQRQGESGDLNGISDWTAKLPGAVLRLAALSHVTENGVEHSEISRATVERMLDLGDLLIQHALAAFSLMGADQAVSDAKYVAARIKASGTSVVRQNEIYRLCHGRIPKMDRLHKALAILIDRNIVSEPQLEPTGGRPSTWFYVNPEFFEDQQ
jgi:putative DNA primase/helicase